MGLCLCSFIVLHILQGTLSCLSPCQTPSGLSLSVTSFSSIVCCFLSCTSRFRLPSLLRSSIAFSLHLYYHLFLIFHSSAAPPVLRRSSFLSLSSSLCATFQVHLLFPLTLMPSVCHILLFLLFYPSFFPLLYPLSEVMSVDTRPSPQPHSSFKFSDRHSFSASPLCYASTACVPAHFHQQPPLLCCTVSLVCHC